MGSPHVSEINTELTAVIRSLQQNQRFLERIGNREAAQLVAMALLQIKMRLHRVEEAELRALCDTVMAERSRDGQPAPTGTAQAPPTSGKR